MKDTIKNLWAAVAGGAVLAVGLAAWAGFSLIGRKQMAEDCWFEAVEMACEF